MQLRRIAIALVVATGTAHAFPTGSQFDLDPVMYDGAGGIAFDGAPRWTSHTCAVCHTNAPGLISIRLEADHPELFTAGYTAAMEYHLRVVMDGEHEGIQYAKYGDNCGFTTDPYQPCDENGFAVELDDINGVPRGTFAVVVDNACAPGSTSTDVDAYILKDGTAAMHSGAHDAQVAWDVCWTAPPAGTGTVTAFIAAVDGNGGDGTINFPNDTIGDDVAAGQVPIAEAGATTVTTQGGGCNAGGDAGAIVAVAIAWLARRRRRKFVALMLVVATAGCAHVRPRQREVLAKRAMKFSPDPAEDELDLHMQESREGSEGGYGSSGGGCGCN